MNRVVNPQFVKKQTVGPEVTAPVGESIQAQGAARPPEISPTRVPDPQFVPPPPEATQPAEPPTTWQKIGGVAKDVGKDIGSDLWSNWPQYGGATYGAAQGYKYGARLGPWSALIGTILGAGIGGATGRSGQLGFEHVFERPMTVMQALEEMGYAASEEAVNEFFGLGLNRILRPLADPVLKVLTPIGKTVTDEARLAYKTLLPYAEKGLAPLTPAQISQAPWASKLQLIAESSFVSFGKMQRHSKKQDVMLQKMQDDLINSFGVLASPTDLGEMIAETILTKGAAINKAMVTPIYNSLYKELGGDILVSTHRITKDPTLLKKFTTLESMGVKRERIKELGIDLYESLGTLEPSVPFSTMEMWSRTLKEILRSGTQQEKKVAGELLSPVEDILTDSAKAVSERAYSFLKLARHQAARKTTTYNDKLVQRLVDLAHARRGQGSQPHKILNRVFEKNGTKGVQAVYNAIGPAKFHNLRAWHVRELFKVPQGEDIALGAVARARIDDMGMKTMKAIYTPDQLKRILDVTTTLEVAQKRLEAGGGTTMMLQLIQASMIGTAGGAVVGLLQGNIQQGLLTGGLMAGAVVYAPRVLADMILDPKYSRLVLNGLKTPRMTGPSVVRFFSAFEDVYERIRKAESNQKLEELRKIGDDILNFFDIEVTQPPTPPSEPFRTPHRPPVGPPEYTPIMGTPDGSIMLGPEGDTVRSGQRMMPGGLGRTPGPPGFGPLGGLE